MDRSAREGAPVEQSRSSQGQHSGVSSVNEQGTPRQAPDGRAFSERGSLPAVEEVGATAGRTASEQAFDNDAQPTTTLPTHIDAHISRTTGGVEVRTDAVPELAGGTWIGRSGNASPTQTGVVNKTGSVVVTLPAPAARSMVSMDLLIQTPDRKFAYRLNCGVDAMAIGDEATGETKITKPVRQLVRSAGGVSPYELSIDDGNSFMNRDLDNAGVAVVPKNHLDGVSSIRAGRGHIRIPDARAAQGTGVAAVINTTTGRTVTSGFIQPDGSFELDFPLEENAKYAVEIVFGKNNERFMGVSFHQNDGANPLILLKL